jgi:hypothetical protein
MGHTSRQYWDYFGTDAAQNGVVLSSSCSGSTGTCTATMYPDGKITALIATVSTGQKTTVTINTPLAFKVIDAKQQHVSAIAAGATAINGTVQNNSSAISVVFETASLGIIERSATIDPTYSAFSADDDDLVIVVSSSSSTSSVLITLTTVFT